MRKFLLCLSALIVIVQTLSYAQNPTNFNDAGLGSDLKSIIYKEFVLFVLCMDQGLDYALEKRGSLYNEIDIP